MKFDVHANNVYSQFGEDGMIAEALNVLGIKRGFAVEFGAGDGLELSNTARLWRDLGWEALLIEAAPDRFESLKHNTVGYNVTISQSMIDPVHLTIDSFVTGRDVDFMSVDIDDCEFQILQTMECRPRLLLVEFNYTMPHHMELVGAVGSRLQASPLSIVKQAESMGYGLLAISGCNCLFVRKPHDQKFEEYDTEYRNLVDPNASTFVVTDYLGKYVFVGPKPHGMSGPYENPPWEVGP